jgi:PAS domain S-box-containing protein
MVNDGAAQGPDTHVDRDPTGLAAGRPADGEMDTGDSEPIERPGLHHWRESTITDADLNDRGGVFFAAIEMTRMPMILTDPNQDDNPIVFANKAFLDLTGYEEAEVLGRNCRFLQGAQTDRNAVAELRDAVDARSAIALELLNYRRDGSPFWNAVFIGPVYDRAGDLRYFFASQLDVTRRRNSEQSYRQAQKMESIGQLTAGLAHDFNNLLQVVNGNLELVSAVADNPERVKRYAAAAQSAAERGAKLTRQLLAFARKTRLEPRPLDLATLVGEFSDLIETSVNGQVDIHLHLNPDLPNVVVDPDQLEMALLNIVNNARDAMPAGGPVTIATERRTLEEETAGDLTPGDYVVLSIADQGHGMSAATLERSTEPFFTTKGVGKGTGLGLAMASGFARQSGGRLEIQSAIGDGTTIRLLFPAMPAHHRSADTPRHVPAVALPADDGTPPHVLVVEDNEEVLAVAQEILKGAGYVVSTALSGDEALRFFEETHDTKRIDLLFTDLVMPGGMNGLSLGDAVSKRDASVSVLMTTGYNEELVADGARARANDVLSKPYRRSELLDRVRQALNRGGEGRARRRQSDFGSVQA